MRRSTTYGMYHTYPPDGTTSTPYSICNCSRECREGQLE